MKLYSFLIRILEIFIIKVFRTIVFIFIVISTNVSADVSSGLLQVFCRTREPSWNFTCGFNKGRSSKFREGSRVRQTPEEGRRTYQPKRCENDNKDEDNSPENLNDKNQQASSQKFRQLIFEIVIAVSILFVSSTMTWNYNCSQVIINGYLKPYTCLQNLILSLNNPICFDML